MGLCLFFSIMYQELQIDVTHSDGIQIMKG